jgi:hypothetical protein
VDRTGREIAITTVEATPGGYADLLAWAIKRARGPGLPWAVEGCRSHGEGLLRVLVAAGQQTVEAGRSGPPGDRTASSRRGGETFLAPEGDS